MVSIAGLAIWVYLLGQRSGASFGLRELLVALAGGAVAESSKYFLTGKHLTPREAAADIFLSGLIAAASSSLLVLQMPAAWPEIFSLSRTVAAAVFALYHAANLRQLAAGRHLSITAGAMIVAPPYLVGALLLLEPASALQALGGLVAGLPPLAHETLELLAHILVVFAFNEVVVQAVGIAVARTPLRSLKAHALLAAVAAAAVAGPWIADLGSLGAAWPPPGRAIAAVAATVFSQAGLWAEVYLVTAVIMAAIHGKILAPAALGNVRGRSGRRRA